MIKKMKKNALLIGTTNLCIECGNHLISLQWNIVGVITNDVAVINWAKSKKITILESLANITFETQSCCLFSIINLSIIKISTLNFYLAINYHDSPLPRYAGVNSTTWAILNREKFHGITWHKIADGIDTGEILIQEQIPILPNETAISLNLKCSECAYYSFIKLIGLIESNQLHPVVQNLSLRTYLGLKYLPDNYGVIKNGDSIENMERMARALYFSTEYDNSVASLKCFVQNTPYILEFRSIAGSGSIDDVANTVFRNIYGDELNINISLDEIDAVILNEEELAILSRAKSNELRLKQHFIQQTSLLDHDSHLLSVNLINQQSIQYVNFSIADYLPAQKNTRAFCYTMIQFVLAKLAMNPFFVTTYGSSSSTSHYIKQLTCQLNIVAITSDLLVNTWDELFEMNVINSTQTHFLTKDFMFRFNLNLNSDIAIIQDGELTYDRLNHGVMFILSSSGICVKYAAENKNIVEKFIYCFNVVLDKLRNNQIQGIPLQRNALVSSTDYSRIVYDWNNTWSNITDETIQNLFESQVLKTPHNIALVHHGTKISFSALNAKVNQYANYLKTTFSILNNDLIVICLNRSIDMVVAMLAVIKAGGAYVPIDPDFPLDRMTYILLDANSKLVITSEIYSSKFYNLLLVSKKLNQNLINIDLIDNTQAKLTFLKFSKENFVADVVSTDLAYVIYTSGTTGSPKGVMVEHGNLNNEIKAQLNFLNFENENSLLTASYVFDAAAECIYMSIYSGGTLHIIDYEDLLNIEEIINYISLNKISVINTTPSYFLNLASYPLVIKYLILGGEEFRQLPSHSIGLVLNTYGPTETTIISTRCVVNDVHTRLIGKPIDNTSLYVLDKNLKPLPVGCIGELYIGGAGVTRGYLNSPLLTEQKFIPNPFQSVQQATKKINATIYKTGDLVRYDNDGNLEYIGRNDFQIKINGFRIELKEIEHALKRIVGIIDAVTIVTKQHLGKASDNMCIAAFYVSHSELSKNDILAKLSVELPDYMVPKILLHLTHLPLTINGKLDINHLQAVAANNTLVHVFSPRNALETELCAVVAEVLGVNSNHIGIDDDFFVLGGNSLLAIVLANKIKDRLQLPVKVLDIFQQRTIRAILNNNNNHLIEFKQYFRFKLKNTTPTATLIFIPGYSVNIYLELINLLNSESAFDIVLLKELLQVYGREQIEQTVSSYCEIIESITFHDQNLILCGFSAGGEIAYMMASRLEKQYGIKLVIFDTVFRNSYYDLLIFKIRTLFKFKTKTLYYHKYPKVNAEILYFYAALEARKRYFLPKEIKFYKIRQIKSDMEYLFRLLGVRFRLQNGLKYFMNVSKIIALEADHQGDNGILNNSYISRITEEINIYLEKSVPKSKM